MSSITREQSEFLASVGKGGHVQETLKQKKQRQRQRIAKLKKNVTGGKKTKGHHEKE